jgi:hypothetical protein
MSDRSAGLVQPGGGPRVVDATVVTAAYTLDRWSLTIAAIESVFSGSVLPQAIIVPVDHNPELLQKLRRWAASRGGDPSVRLEVVESRYAGHLGASATTAVQLASTEYIVFLDDDAAADPEWLARMIAAFDDPTVVAVGGAPLPRYGSARPRWFPEEFNWVFGCAYAGLPREGAPILHMIGTTMAARRDDILAIGGIHSNDHGDMELSHRLMERYPGRVLLYEPRAVVRHYVHPDRLTWSYFWRRCFAVNRSKVAAMRGMGAAAHLRAERRFAARALTNGIRQGFADVLRGDPHGFTRALAIEGGIVLAGLGYVAGTVEWMLGRRPPPEQAGWQGPLLPIDG